MGYRATAVRHFSSTAQSVPSCIAIGPYTLTALDYEPENLRLFTQCRNFYQFYTTRLHRIVVGFCAPDCRQDTRRISIAIATDQHRSKLNAITFSDALYDLDDIFCEVVMRANHHAPNNRSPIIPYSYDERFHFDSYRDFLSSFQHSVPLTEMMRAARQLIDPRPIQSSAVDAMTPQLRGRIAWLILEHFRDTLEHRSFPDNNPLHGTVSALEFLGRMRLDNIPDRTIIEMAELIGSRLPDERAPHLSAAPHFRGFAAYVRRAARTATPEEINVAILRQPRRHDVNKNQLKIRNTKAIYPKFVI